jgi:acyl-CoA synthetase (AMP-forming)/AMP-acid ligase II
MSLLVGDVMARAAARTPRAGAVAFGQDRWTFAELDAAADRLGASLRDAGVDYGHRVGWRAQPSVGAAALFVAVARLGAAFVPLNRQLSEAELAPILAKARLHHLLDGTPPLPAAATGRLVEPWLNEGDPHVIFFTSGSTGAPKGVVLSQRASFLRSFPGYLGGDGPGMTVCMFPLFHMAPWSIAMGCWQAGHGIVFVSRAEPDELAEAITRNQATRLYAIPAVWSRLLAAGISGRDLPSLRVADTGTSATPPELLAAIKEAFPGTTTRVFYGSTEAGPATWLGDEDLLSRPGSVGLPAFGVDVRVAEDGEVCVRSDYLMDGYFEDEEATTRALVDGWYHTGDAGALDDHGYLSITGRLRDVIRTGGETVAPTEVEAVLTEHPSVAEAAVVGLPDVEWGEVVCAAIVVRPGLRVELADLREHCEGRLARYKHPRRLAVVDALPRTPATGQVQRTLLIERLGSQSPGSG